MRRTSKKNKKPKNGHHWAAVMDAIRSDNVRKMNWFAMKYYLLRGMHHEAGECRARVGPHGENGPV